MDWIFLTVTCYLNDVLMMIVCDHWSNRAHWGFFRPPMLLGPLSSRHLLIKWEAWRNIFLFLGLFGHVQPANLSINKQKIKRERDQQVVMNECMVTWDNAAWVCSGGQRKGKERKISIRCLLPVSMFDAATGDTTSISKNVQLAT